MPDWNAAQYLQFQRERTQPAIDLARRIPDRDPRRVLDVGCGPGNSTAVLQEQFPGAAILGIDSSPAMIAAAEQAHPGLRFQLADAAGELETVGGEYDVVFSNACLQWVPDHGRVIPRLLSLLRPGGYLAVQVPVNEEEPIHRLLKEAAASSRWAARFPNPRIFHTLAPGDYYDLLSRRAAAVELWRTTYCHVLASHEAILDWYRGTGLRPYLAALDEEEGALFERDILEKLRPAYPVQADGRILFPFPRLFFLAQA